jgi:two-component system, OmpR family, sensor histidine kinase TctE
MSHVSDVPKRDSDTDFSNNSAPASQQSLDSPLHLNNDETSQRSLFGEILDWMLAPLLLLWPVSIAITYLIANSIADQPFDRALEDRVLVLAQQIQHHDPALAFNSTARAILRADELDMIYFQITDDHGKLIAGDADLPPLIQKEDEKPVLGAVNLRDAQLHGITLRIASSHVAFSAAPNSLLIQVAETTEKRNALASDIIKSVILPQFIIFPLALALTWLALSRGLLPLTRLQRRIRSRNPDDLSPIDAQQVPEEITPLVNSLNEMLERLKLTIHTQKRFIANAAHQMKTPLAGMRMQAELALRETDRDEIQRSLTQLAKSSEDATRMVNQLLALARAENMHPSAAVGKAMSKINLCELVSDTVRDWIPASFAKRIDLGLDVLESESESDIEGKAVFINGDAIALRELLNNLIDNALRYTPAGNSVTVRAYLAEADAVAVLEVEDNGIGIPESERNKVFDRFYRVLGTNVAGSGLGLAIVREIALQHQAEITIADHPAPINPQTLGCIIQVRFKALGFAEWNNYGE